MFWRNWDVWPCTHACTAFFAIPYAEVSAMVPAPLVAKRDKHGRAQIELGYVRFRTGIHGLPATEEMAWGIAVERRSGVGFAFYAMNIAADNVPFLDWNANIGFNVYRPPVQFSTDLDRRSFEVSDAAGQICVLRHQPEGSISLPFFPVDTEVWTSGSGKLQRRLFKWKGTAKVHLAAPVASTLCPHPFFGGVRVDRAEPVPAEVFSSEKVSEHTAQLFTPPDP